MCTAGYPIRYEDGIATCFCLVDVKISNVVNGLNNYALKVFIPLLAATALLAWFMSRRIRWKVAKPINAIANAAQDYVQDRRAGSSVTDHFSSLNIHSGDELENLSLTMADMEQQLAQHEKYIKQITAEKERIEAELSLATQIQESMLPHIVPVFPDRKDFDIIGSMDPAKEVGGDFYDYFLIDGDHLCMVIADVSGKGVPGALFMMVTKIILQNVAISGDSPGDILTKTNAAVCSNNEAGMFVTVWIGILELSTGKLTCANAGHEYPVFKHPDGSFVLYKDKHGFVLGGLEGAIYKEYEIQLEPGAKLFVYTDGVPEATAIGGEMFGTERMISALNTCADDSPNAILDGVRNTVDAFVGDAEQFDDLTMMCLEYCGPQESACDDAENH